MPHIIVKLIPGRSEEMKMNLAKQIAEDVSKGLDIEMGYVSVAFEEVDEELRNKYELHMKVERYVSDEEGIPTADKKFIRN